MTKLHIAIHAKDIDFSLGIRSGDWTQGSSLELDQSYQELKRSIEAFGQLEPCLVRPRGEPGRHQMISGHRRAAAIIEIAKEQNKEAWIDCLSCEDMSDETAYAAAIACNTRSTVLASDLTVAILRYSESIVPSISTNELARRIGMNPAYTGRLLRIGHRLLPELLKEWTHQSVILSVAEVERVALMAPEKQRAAWDKKLASVSTRFDERTMKNV